MGKNQEGQEGRHPGGQPGQRADGIFCEQPGEVSQLLSLVLMRDFYILDVLKIQHNKEVIV